MNLDVVCNMIEEGLQAYDLQNQHMGKTLICNLINSHHINGKDVRKLVEDGLRRFNEQTMIGDQVQTNGAKAFKLKRLQKVRVKETIKKISLVECVPIRKEKAKRDGKVKTYMHV